MNQHTVFPINSRHRVVCPNRVVKLRRNTVWLEHDFEGSDEIEFEVSLQQFCRPYHSAGEPASPAASSGLWPVNPYGDPPVCGGKRHRVTWRSTHIFAPFLLACLPPNARDKTLTYNRNA